MEFSAGDQCRWCVNGVNHMVSSSISANKKKLKVLIKNILLIL